MLVAPLWLDSHNQLLQIFAQYFNGQIKDTDLDHVQALLIGKTCLVSVKILRSFISRFAPFFAAQSAEQLAQFFERIHFFLSNTVDCCTSSLPMSSFDTFLFCHFYILTCHSAYHSSTPWRSSWYYCSRYHVLSRQLCFFESIMIIICVLCVADVCVCAVRALGTRTTSTLSQVLADIMVYMMRFAVDTAETFPLTFVPSLERFLTFCDKQYFSSAYLSLPRSCQHSCLHPISRFMIAVFAHELCPDHRRLLSRYTSI